MNAIVEAVHMSEGHSFSKQSVPAITLLRGIGIEGDAHAGVAVRHRSRVAVDPSQPNLRQVHFMHAELFDELTYKGFTVYPGDLGENITTRGVELLGLSRGTILKIGEARIEITGLRNPCNQIENFQTGLLAEVVGKDEEGTLIRKAGIMGIVLEGGAVKPGDKIEVMAPKGAFVPLERV